MADKHFDFLQLLNKFIFDLERGRHLQKNGTRLKSGSIQNYKSMRTVVEKFILYKSFELRIADLSRCTKQQFKSEQLYWKKFHQKISDFMYRDCDHYDNYVGATFKLIRSFLNYLHKEKGIDIKEFHKKFHVVSEQIPFVTLNPEQLNFLIYDKDFENGLPKRLKTPKDIFVFGCTVGLRISDLMLLSNANLERVFGNYYLKVQSKKTHVITKIKLPDYAIEILQRYNRQKTIFPSYHLFTLNKHFREIAELAGWTYIVPKKRQKRGIQKTLRQINKQVDFRFCDLITTHTMRRTAITTLLNLGMPEHMVRKISGHSAGSKEFFRYVQYAQTFLDQETDKVHLKLRNQYLN